MEKVRRVRNILKNKRTIRIAILVIISVLFLANIQTVNAQIKENYLPSPTIIVMIKENFAK